MLAAVHTSVMADSSHASIAISVDHDEAGAHRSSGPATEEILGPHDEQPATTWDIVCTITCVFAVFLDPVYPYITFVDGDRMCYDWDPYLMWSFAGLVFTIDVIYILDVRPWSFAVLPTWSIVVPPTIPVINISHRIICFRSLPTPTPLYLFLLPVQYPQRVYHTYKLLKRYRNIETKKGRWLNAILDFLPFILAAHLYGAMWYLLSLLREVDCWQHASPTYVFKCGEYLHRNITHTKASCPINPPDATIFDFGIFLYALQSNTTRSTSIPRKMFQCFWWGLRNLSSFGSNLQTSLYWGEILFTILVSISGMVLFLIYLNTYVGAMRNSRAVAPSSALVDELVKKNADLADKLSNERILHDARISEMNESMSALKSSVGQKDGELESLMATLLERALAQDRDKLLAKFDTHVEAMEASKHEIAANAYKFGYLDCRNGASPCCPLEDDDGEPLCLDLPPAQSEQIYAVDVEAVEEQVANETTMEEDNAQGGTTDEVRADAEEQAAEAAEQMVPVEQSDAISAEDVTG